jgi:hypothetical protein
VREVSNNQRKCLKQLKAFKDDDPLGNFRECNSNRIDLQDKRQEKNIILTGTIYTNLNAGFEREITSSHQGQTTSSCDKC